MISVVVISVLVVVIAVVVVVVAMVLEVLLVVVVLAVTVVVRALECAGAVIDAFVELLAVDMRDNMLVIESDVAVELSVDVLTSIILPVVTSIGVDVLMDLNVNVFADAMTAFEFAMVSLLENFRCCAVFDCRSMAASDCVSVLQTWMPSYHV